MMILCVHNMNVEVKYILPDGCTGSIDQLNHGVLNVLERIEGAVEAVNGKRDENWTGNVSRLRSERHRFIGFTARQQMGL